MFKRTIRVEASYEKDGTPFFYCDNLRVHCEMEEVLGAGELAQSHLTIYNLSRESSNALRYSDLSVATTGDASTDKPYAGIWIKVYAGYEDELMSDGNPTLILDGRVMNSYAIRRRPNFETHLFIQAAAGEKLRATFDPVTIKDGTVKDAIDGIAAANGLTVQYFVDEATLAETKVQGQVFGPETDFAGAIQQLTKEHQLNFIVRSTGLSIYPNITDNQKSRSAFNHLTETGTAYIVDALLLKGFPHIGIMSVEMTLTLRPELFPGWIVDLTKIPELAVFDNIGQPLYLQTDVASVSVIPQYLVWKVIHKFDNYEDVWETTLVGTAPGAGGDVNHMERAK